MYIVLEILTGYLVGSIPSGYLLAKYFGHIDVRAFGSGSTGATNVFRSGHKKLGALTLLLDFLKGLLLCLAFAQSDNIYWIAFACLIGHAFPIWLGWRGGKCVAASAGIFMALDPTYALVSILFCALTLKLSDISALASLVLGSCFTLCTLAGYCVGVSAAGLCIFSFLVLVILLVTHRSNLKRLIAHEEGRLRL